MILLDSGAMLQLEQYRYGWPVLPPGAAAKGPIWSLGLQQPGSGMTFMASIATEDCVDVQVMLLSKGNAEARVIQI